MIEIILNGEKKSVAEGAKISDLVAAYKLEKGRLACELNQTIVPRAAYAATTVKNGDVVEIVQMIGGG
jgi:sulfur carrier protein